MPPKSDAITSEDYNVITREDCSKWVKKPLINPKTGYSIKPKGPTYNQLKEACKKYGLNASPDIFASRTVGPYVMPQTKQEWEIFENKFSKIILLQNGYQIIAEDDYAAIPYYAEMCELAIELGLCTDCNKVKDLADKFHQLMKPDHGNLIIKPIQYTSQLAESMLNEFTENLKKIEQRFIRDGVTEENLEMFNMIKQDLQKVNYLKAQRYNPPKLNENIIRNIKILPHSGHLYAIERDIKYMQLVKNLIEKPLFSEINANTRSRSLPESISIDKRTERESFRRHSAMSRMTPLTPAVIESLPQKTRVQLLNDMRAACISMKDNITQKRFDRMHKKALHLVVQLGNQEKKSCYYVRNIYKLWEYSIKDKKALIDPATRVPVTETEKTDIIKKMTILDKNAVNLDNVKKNIPKRDVALALIIEQEDDYYHLAIMRKFGNTAYLIFDLGCIPSNINSIDDDINISSSTVIANIRKLFDEGKLLISNFAPYTCCTISLQKPKEYWEGSNRLANFKLMSEEIANA
jgi:hypothetical protein